MVSGYQEHEAILSSFYTDSFFCGHRLHFLYLFISSDCLPTVHTADGMWRRLWILPSSSKACDSDCSRQSLTEQMRTDSLLVWVWRKPRSFHLPELGSLPPLLSKGRASLRSQARAMVWKFLQAENCELWGSPHSFACSQVGPSLLGIHGPKIVVPSIWGRFIVTLQA